MKKNSPPVKRHKSATSSSSPLSPSGTLLTEGELFWRVSSVGRGERAGGVHVTNHWQLLVDRTHTLAGSVQEMTCGMKPTNRLLQGIIWNVIAAVETKQLRITLKWIRVTKRHGWLKTYLFIGCLPNTHKTKQGFLTFFEEVPSDISQKCPRCNDVHGKTVNKKERPSTYFCGIVGPRSRWTPKEHKKKHEI